MKLTAALRAAFVNAVLADIKTKLDDDAIRKFVTDEAVASLPPAVRAIYDNPATRPYVQHKVVNFESRTRSHPGLEYSAKYLYAPGVQVPGTSSYEPSMKTTKRIAKLLEELEAKVDAKDSMKVRLTQMANSCKTREALAELLPHLENYIPKPPPKEMAHPVPAVLVKDMIRELKKLGVPSKEVEVAA